MPDQAAKSLSLRQLELLLALASADSIAGAGARLGMTPSATSHALRTLEATLGAPLLDRNASGVHFTYAGQQILPHVRDVFASLQIVRATASASAGLRSGLLNLGSLGASSSLNILPQLLEMFKARYPGVDVFVTEKPDTELERALIERRIEIGVVALPKPDFDTLALVTDELMAVLPAGHPLAERKTIAVKDLIDYPLIMTRAGSQPVITRMFERAGAKPHIAHDLSQIMSILEFVRRGQGISVLASLVLPQAYDGLVYRKISPASKRRLGLACLNERKLSPAAHAFWAMVREAAPKLKFPVK
ncbi:LysR family transcriptional regulator [Achromobacter insolitus]|jgi:DNA-binding transcriptional LysR family regulator|uniref:HTH-type transcriptional regulator CynR n=1 Tax=Achromobacter insolitus TaxID=217204 RepID=A0A6S7EV49_9BURK|nr:MULTISPECIES: LysR family transcriptional regulator [Achromobacter]GLK93748.1 LysR family transcriptional regulator [Achromobacter xylosoxidans]AVG39182.1 LysR family transcriptional regulator [Achromobacter insolitus]AXA69866.1 LysR family transcriptional regulator [Achromobacter insolitus]MCP1403522.1 DNA-binding transcriptional LysR family regulator [Achromobacter insolitus]MDH3064838.1 LysR family transcriptional regulator [Achromobacter insolitus]